MSSLFRTGIRVAIRNVAPPILMVIILYKFYQKIEPMPWFQSMVETYRKLYWRMYWGLREMMYEEDANVQ